jgi:putative addiction module component (TIGR02574 family)
MIALEAIHQLPLKEKLFIMEALWNDLAQTEETQAVPQWHKDILDEREQQITDGKAKFINWEDAKQQIRATVR